MIVIEAHYIAQARHLFEQMRLESSPRSNTASNIETIAFALKIYREKGIEEGRFAHEQTYECAEI